MKCGCPESGSLFGGDGCGGLASGDSDHGWAEPLAQSSVVGEQASYILRRAKEVRKTLRNHLCLVAILGMVLGVATAGWGQMECEHHGGMGAPREGMGMPGPGPEPPPAPGPRGPWFEDRDFCKGLGLSESDVERIGSLHRENRKEAIRLKADLEVKEVELGELLKPDAPDEARAKAKAREISDLRGRMFLNDVEMRLQVRRMLTAEQEQKVREYHRGKACCAKHGPKPPKE